MAEVLARVLQSVEKEVSVDKGEMILVTVAARGIISVVSLSVFCSL